MALDGKPSIGDPRQGPGGAIEPRSTQLAIRNIRERLRLIDQEVNALSGSVTALRSTAPTAALVRAAGSDGSVQFNAAGAFAASGDLRFDPLTGTLYALNYDGGLVNALDFGYGTEQGRVTLLAGSNVSIVPLTGGAYEISATGGGGSFVAGAGIQLNPLSGGAYEIVNIGVRALNGLTGTVSLVAGSNVTLTLVSGNAIEIAAAGGGGGGFYREPVANGDPDNPEVVFADGDFVFVTVPVLT